MEGNNKLELLGNAPIPKALMSLGIPIMIGMLINALYNLVDAYFVGALGDSQMGAISIIFPLGQVVVGLGLMFGNGAASYLSRLLGSGDKETANKVASTALYSSVLIGAAIILIATVFLEPLLVMLGATDTIIPYALMYGRIYVVSCIFNVFNVTMNNIVSSEGAAKTTMCALLLGAVLNIALDPLFIYTFNMGVAGAAIATAISQMVSTLVYLTYVFRKQSAFTFSIKLYAPSRKMMAEILKIGIPTLAFQLLTSLSIALINRSANGYLGAPSVSTQHGVKGEGHNNVCFIAEDSTRNPIVYMYEFFQLLCAEDINLTDFQNFYYDYVSEIKSINLTYLKPAKTYKAHEGEYLQYAQYIKNKYKDNKYFLFCQQKYYDKYLGNPNSTNAKDCFKSTKIQGILWAYKLFYVGCSRAKENLVIVIDENKIAPFRKEFIKRMTAIGFDVNGI